MDPRLLQYYNTELQHLREMGAEFAQQFPKVAARLGMSGLEVADPYVERLLEGVGFLAARVQLKLDAEFPRFTQALLEIVYPHYLAPTPAMIVARFEPDKNDPALAQGTKIVPRGTILRSALAADDVTECEFRTAHAIALAPVEVSAASYFAFAPDLPLNTLPIAARIKGGLRIRLRTTGGVRLEQTNVDRLTFYLGGRDDVANRLLELLLGNSLGVLVRGTEKGAPLGTFIKPSSIRHVGFEDDEALLPVSPRTFQGYRVLQEYFAFPQRGRFVEIAGLAEALRQARGQEAELVVLSGRSDPTLDGVVDASNFQLYCTPAINLFDKPRMDRILIADTAHEFHVVADRTRPLDFEIYQVSEVVGHGDEDERQFLPFYATENRHSGIPDAAFFTVRREPRLVSQEQKRRGTRSSYIGSELFLSLVDAKQAPYAADLRQLSIKATCTNRDLPLQMPMGLGSSDFSLNVAVPITSVRVIAGPSRPYSPLADGAVSWRAISHLSSNYLSLIDADPQAGASALREVLELYATTADVSARRQIDGVRSVSVNRVVRRLPGQGPIAFGRGLEITVDIDELAFEGASAIMLGAVLHQYLARYVAMNTVTETVLRSQSRGEINRWTPSWGTRPIL